MFCILPEARFSEEKLDELEKKVGDDRIIVFAAPALPRRKPLPMGTVEFEIVFRPPTEEEWHVFKLQSSSSVSEDTKVTAQRNLAMLCVIAVNGGSGNPQQDFSAVLKKYPAIPEAASTAIGKVAGFDLAATEKK